MTPDLAPPLLLQVREGACPSSFGIHVAEAVGFPASVLAQAREKAAQLEATSGGARAILAAAAAVAAPEAQAGPAARAAGGKRFASELASRQDFPGLSGPEKRACIRALLKSCPA